MLTEFFSPNDKFLEFLQKYKKGRTILEVGCGTAPIARRLKGVIPIDLFSQEGQPFNTIIIDAAKFPFGCSHLVVMARPCHNDWTEKTIEAATSAGTEVLYVGLEENIEQDLSPETNFTRLRSTDKEHIILSIKPPSKMKTFVLLKTDYFTAWMEDTKGWYRNTAGGGQPKDRCDGEVIETQEAEDFHDLDWTKTDLARKNGESQHGWVTPDGTFWACDYMAHDRVIDLWFKKEVGVVEAAGWARVSGSTITCQKSLTEAQAKTLAKKGLEVPEWMMGKV